MSKYLAVMLGGATGAVARFIVGTLVVRFYSAIFPLGTFLINVTGSFFIGLLMTFFLNRPAVHPNWRLFLITGILGGYTTFSSFEWEALATWRSGAEWIAVIYLGASVIMGLGSAWLGLVAANRLWPH
jgi:fluoride exporter